MTALSTTMARMTAADLASPMSTDTPAAVSRREWVWVGDVVDACVRAALAEDLPPDDNRRSQPRFQDENAAHNARIADLVREFAARKGCTPAQLAIAWVLAQGEHILPIPGMKTRAHLADNLGALEVKLTAEECREIAARIDELGVRGDRHPPAMMQALDR